MNISKQYIVAPILLLIASLNLFIIEENIVIVNSYVLIYHLLVGNTGWHN